jgi:hypothetical protein
MLGPVKNEERDRFGLPRHWTFLDDDQQFNERMAATEVFVRDAVEALIHQVLDHKTAKRILLEELDRHRPLRKSPGRPPDKKKNAALVDEFERQRKLGLSIHDATCAAADELELAQKGKKKVKGEAFERRIRRQRKKLAETAQRDETAQRASEEALKKFSPLLIEEILSEPKADT